MAAEDDEHDSQQFLLATYRYGFMQSIYIYILYIIYGLSVPLL